MRPSFKNVLFAALMASVALHLLTGWDNILILLPMLAVIVWLIANTWGDGLRALRICAEESEVDDHAA